LRWWFGAVEDEEVMHEYRHSNLPVGATPTSAGELPHGAVLLDVGKP
jgi:hypothetical protein